MTQEQTDQVVDVRDVVRPSTALILKEYAKTILVTLVVALAIKACVLEAFRIPSGSMENTLQIGDFLLVNKLAYGLRTPRRIPLTSISLPTVSIPWREVRRGDVVVFEFPQLEGSVATEGFDVNYIKRCIGLPGDTVALRQGRVFINGRELLFSRTVKMNGGAGPRAVPGGAYTEDDFGPVVVPYEGQAITLTAENAEEWKALLHHEGQTLDVLPDGTVTLDGQPADSYTVAGNYYFMLGDNRRNSMDSRFWGFVPEENLVGEALLVYWSWDPDVAWSSFGRKLASIRWERIGTLVR